MNKKDIQDLAELAKIELSEEEVVNLLSDMESTLAYIEQIKSAKTDDSIRADVQYQNINTWRDDIPKSEDEEKSARDLIIKQFPDSQDGFVKVKKIL